MKKLSYYHSRRGFTLIELLVVISIIAVLAAAGFGVGVGILNRARKLSAENTATSINQAINMFYSEYGTFPTRDTSGRVNTADADGLELLEILMGNDPEMNPRGLSILSVKDGSPRGAGGVDGIVYNNDNTVRGVYDPWGNGFTIEMDIDFNEYLEFTPVGIDGASPIRLNGRRVAVYSPGVAIGETARIRDMAKSW